MLTGSGSGSGGQEPRPPSHCKEGRVPPCPSGSSPYPKALICQPGQTCYDWEEVQPPLPALPGRPTDGSPGWILFTDGVNPTKWITVYQFNAF